MEKKILEEKTVFVCPVCGKEHDKRYYSSSSSKYADLCNNYECYETVFWLDIINNYNNTKMFTINGAVYELGDNKGWDKGYGGNKFVIRPNRFNGDKSKDITTTDLWFRGDVPKKFKQQLPDNAVFVVE